MHSPTALLEPVLANETERESLGRVEKLLDTPGDDARLVGPDGDETPIPHSLYHVLREAVGLLARGHGVGIMPLMAELTTQQAAELLKVSRPFLVKLLEESRMPFHKVGTHRRVYLRDLLAYKASRDDHARRTLGALAADAQELGIYDE